MNYLIPFTSMYSAAIYIYGLCRNKNEMRRLLFQSMFVDISNIEGTRWL